MVAEVVDPHVHHWLPSANKWYPLLADPAMSAIAHDYVETDYRADSASYPVTAIVHVSATSKPGAYLEEAAWIEELAAASGWPAAAVGAVDVDKPWEAMEADLEAQARNARLRGIRVLFGLDPGSDQAVHLVRWLEAKQLIFDMVAHPGEVPAYLKLLDAAPGLKVVLEHAGWPDGGEKEHFEAWRAGLDKLAERPNVNVKISGLAMELHTLDAQTQRPWIEGVIEAFGVDRSMFASNFPVDRMFGSFSDLYSTYEQAAAGLADADQAKLFAANARRIYSL